MAKFIKSIFQTSDKRRSSKYDDSEEDRANLPPLDGRRKLSISRSGRMKQANKKRHSLSLELYNHEIHISERPKCPDYHIISQTVIDTKTTNLKRSQSIELKSPEEEIDSAFEIIEKSMVMNKDLSDNSSK